MADFKKRVDENIEGDFFVDRTCINCDTCRQLAPETFEESNGHSFVYQQPADKAAMRRATQALLACPTGSIGTLGENLSKDVIETFPLVIQDCVYYCGFNSPRSYGGNSYFVHTASGNWLVDSPKYLPHLVKQFHKLGGLSYIFLTHQDDVADAAKFAQEFGAKRIIHAEDQSAQPDAEIILAGNDPVNIDEEFLIIPTPGHTAGHCVLLFKEKYLFTGDHLEWDRYAGRLSAYEDYCWYSWKEQTKSMARLIEYPFEWILPGHGQRVKLPLAEMKEHLENLVERMKRTV